MFKTEKKKRLGCEGTLSIIAEEGRKHGCLCIHYGENGELIMCQRLKNTIALRKWYSGIAPKFELVALSAQEALSKLLFAKSLGRSPWKDLLETDPCPVAQVLFATCQAGPLMLGVSFCPGYLPSAKTEEAEKDCR